jgi:hypothetical protein
MPVPFKKPEAFASGFLYHFKSGLLLRHEPLRVIIRVAVNQFMQWVNTRFAGF